MTEENNQTETKGTTAKKGSWSKRLIIGGVAAVVIAGAGAAAFANNGHWGKHGMMRGFMEYRMEQMLTEAGANDEQKSKLKALVTATIDEVRPGKEARQAMRDEVIKLLEAPTIDRAAIEAVRVKHMAEFETRSKTVAKAVADAAEILTPEQRKKLIEEMDDFGPHGRW